MFRWLLNVHNVPVVDNISGNTNGNSGIPQPVNTTVTTIEYNNDNIGIFFIVIVAIISAVLLFWYLWRVNKEDKIKKSQTDEKNTQEYEIPSDEGSISTEQDSFSCIICNEKTDAKHFCKNCYEKYKNSSLIVKIINCEKVNIIDESPIVQTKEIFEEEP